LLKGSGKTSLLFQFAVNRAAESGRGVVFLCSKGRLESNPPFLSQVRILNLVGSVAYGERPNGSNLRGLHVLDQCSSFF
jgi:hypothetical protein